MFSSFDVTVGGGFVNEGGPLDSGGRKKKQAPRLQSVVPLIIRQINSCKDEEFNLHGLPVQIAEMVVILEKFDVQSNKVSCVLLDHSARMKAILWLEADSDSDVAIPPVKEGHYVQVFGTVRTQGGERILMILKMFPIDNMDIITNHRLRMLHIKLYAEKLAADGFPDDANMTNQPNASTSGISFSDMKVEEKRNPDGLKQIEFEILQLLKPVAGPEGLHISVILKKMAPAKEKDVRSALLEMKDEGHIYTTVDSDHYKATDGL